MILQRDASDPVWGWATAGNVVTVVIKDQNNSTLQTRTATAGSDSRWQVSVGPFSLVPGNAAYSMTVSSSGQTTQNFTDILIGDVWLCTGQSNMDFGMSAMGASGGGTYNMANDIADSANYPTIREFHVTNTSVTTPQVTVPSTTWKVASPSTTGGFSATGYFTARAIYRQQGVPVGILHSAWGGTEIKLWLDAATISNFGDLRQAYFDQVTPPAGDGRDTYAGGYNGMIAPIAPLSFKAVIWYQGEYNSDRPEQYGRLLPALISQWRALFSKPTLPFLIVQLPNSDGYAQIRQSQMNTVRGDSNARLVVTNDIGESMLHPADKEDVGLRAAWAANDLVYGRSGPTGAPLFTGATVSGNTIRCSFSNVGLGLMVGLKTINQSGPQTPVQQVSGGTLNGFTIAGSNKVYVAATATIDSTTNTVLVSAASVPSPLYVRYAWTAAAAGNLYARITNSGGNVVDGNPVSPFTNDIPTKISVSNGTGSGTTSLGSHPSIGAPANTGQAFDHWSGDASDLANATSASTTASISKYYTSVYANYLVTGSPTNLHGTGGPSQIDLSWTAMANVHYNIKRSTVSGGPYVTIASKLVGTTTYSDTAVTPGTTYYYVISAESVLGDGPDSAQIAVLAPNTVGGLIATAGSAQVDLSWSTFSGALSYNLKRGTTSTGPFATIASGATATTYTDRAVISGVTYYYIVTAVSSGSETPNSTAVAATPTFLASPLLDQDIGSVGFAGAAKVNSASVYTIDGSGADIWNSADAFHFVYQIVNGDCTLTARVTSLENTYAWAKAVVMIRSSLEANSATAQMVIGATAGAAFQWRPTNGGTAAASNTVTGITAPYWIRIVRTGNSFTAFYSSNGASWTQTGSAVSISMPTAAYVGLGTCAHDNTKVCTATFDNVTGLTLQTPPAPARLGVTTSPATHKAVLSWNASTGAAIGYNIKRAPTSGGPYTTIASSQNVIGYTDTSISTGSTYYYTVSGLDSAGEGSNAAQARADLTPPVVIVPANIIAQATSTNGTSVTFNTGATDDTDGVLSPTNSPASGSLFAIGTTTVTTSATDSTGNTDSKTFSVSIVWPTPVNLAATALSETQVQLTWDATAANNAPFVIQRSPRNTSIWTTLTSTLPVGSTSYIDSTASASTGYDYRIQSSGSGVASDFTSLSTTTPAGIGDGIPGSWRYQYFGNGTTTTPASDTHADPDGDGMDNLQEYLSGTIPTDPASALRPVLAISGNNIVITFPSVSGKTYLFERTTDLKAPSWTTVQDNITGTGADISLTDSGAATLPVRFYRVELK